MVTILLDFCCLSSKVERRQPQAVLVCSRSQGGSVPVSDIGMLERTILPCRGVPSFVPLCGYREKRHVCAIEDHTDCNCEDRKPRPALPFVLAKHSPKIIALFRDRRGWECIRLGLVCEGETQSSVICISDLTASSLPRRRGGTDGVCTNWAEYLWSKYLWPRLVDAPSCYQDPTAIPAAIGTASRKILSSWWVLIA